MEKILKNLPRKYKSGLIQIFSIVLQAISNKMDGFEDDYLKVIASCSIITAEDFWLDFWGFFYKIRRFLSETDVIYRERILTYIRYGMINHQSIVKTAKLYSSIEPTLIEHHGEIVIDYDYLTYNYDFSNFLMTLKYNPSFISNELNKTFFVEHSFIGYNSFIVETQQRYPLKTVKNIINNSKTAGVKLIHDIT